MSLVISNPYVSVLKSFDTLEVKLYDNRMQWKNMIAQFMFSQILLTKKLRLVTG